ncbi:MAG: ATP-grasp domain-containing protein, partial [Gammaproteobacteria bacterium]|nr:ATP-grasp domain-containing protein [Gammaproteobacteria bacterium]
MTINSILIANRGEIAVRVIHACRALGIRSVQAHSVADADSLAVRLADEAVEIGPPPAAKSYLNIEALIGAARATGVDAVHPGYGFLAENADFADAVAAAGMIFVGPDGDSIRLLGDKVSARQAAAKAGVPTVPGSDGRVREIDEARGIVEDIGFPVMIKAVAGGGGRGIRVAADFDEFERFFPQASAEAAAAFGDGGLYIEKLIDPARHIEVQVLGDGQRFIHCFERECSLQRRRQKIWEEAPAFDLAPAVREAMCASAVALAKLVGYRGAGTVEFLYDGASQSFYFIEVNTRIQVEHPVTEMVTGIDLVQAMIRIAGGEPLAIA